MAIIDNIIIDLSYLSEVSAGNTEFMIEMIDIFQAQTPGQVSDLTLAVKEKDWKKIGEIAHKIKPTLAFMGVNDAKEIMAEMELYARKEENYEEIVMKMDGMQEVFVTIFDKLNNKKQELLAQDS